MSYRRTALKRAWFNMDHSKTPVKKQVIVTMGNNPHWPGYGEVKIIDEGPESYSSFTTHQENPVKYAKDRMKVVDGTGKTYTDYSEYDLIIDGELQIPCSAELDNEWANESI